MLIVDDLGAKRSGLNLSMSSQKGSFGATSVCPENCLCGSRAVRSRIW
jgi:hypothetical protein